MYVGRRDPEIGIVAEQVKCSIYTSKNGGTWVEVMVPPECVSDYEGSWGSMMVEKKQVDNIAVGETGYNYVRVNDMADIVVSVKDANHAVVGGETLKPVQIIGRYLKYYRWAEYHENHPEIEITGEFDRPSLDLYNDMASTGMSMMTYMNRLPKVLPRQYIPEELMPEDPLAGMDEE